MPSVVIAEVRAELDGEYELDSAGFTNFELHAIKRLCGLAAGDFADAFARRDNDMLMALGMVALMRAGRIVGRTPWTSPEVAALWDAPVGSITVTDDEEADAVPPAVTPEQPASEDAVASKNGSSGDSSNHDSGLPENAPSLTGGPT
jgi:hypothetical protein